MAQASQAGMDSVDAEWMGQMMDEALVETPKKRKGLQDSPKSSKKALSAKGKASTTQRRKEVQGVPPEAGAR